jgi:hypothetical protein
MKRIFVRIIVMAFIIAGIPGLLSAQQGNTRDLALPQGTVDKILNNAFGSLVGATPNSGEMANYASLDLLNATFNLKGYFSLHGNESRSQKGKSAKDTVLQKNSVSYLSFALSGNLADKNYASLFSNASLNAGVSGQLAYNFRLSPIKFSYSRDQWDLISFQLDELKSRYQRNYTSLDMSYSDSANQAGQILLSQEIVAAKARLTKLQSLAALLNKSIDSLGAHAGDHPELIDSLVKVDNSRRTLQTSLGKYYTSLDSLTNLAKNENAFIGMQHEEEERQKFVKNRDSIVNAVPLLRLSTSWFSILGGFTEKNFYTYTPALQYSAQIASNKLGVFNVGAAYNYFNQDKLVNRIVYFNGAVSWLRDNNLSSLTAKEIDQVKTSVNAGGDTVRTISSKYNAYTSPVVNYYAWNLTANVYYLHGKMPTGIHLSPSYNFQNNGLNIANLQVGYIFSFKNASKGKTLLNTELYVQFKDLFNQQKLQPDFWRREVIGISFALPFNTIN